MGKENAARDGARVRGIITRMEGRKRTLANN
jgi:hypothetical protein